MRFFVYKYLLYLGCVMGVQILELCIIILGSIKKGYFDYDTIDGYKYYRYCYLIG
jgi:hypothetical protein